MAAGKVLLGDPWFGILISCALMCAAICWMLQAWLPPTWALLGGVLAILRLGLFQLLDQYLHGRCRNLCSGRRAGSGRFAPIDEDSAVSLRHADGGGHCSSCPHSPVRRPAGLPAGRGRSGPLGFLWKEPATRRRAASPRGGASGPDRCRRRMAGILRLSRIRQPVLRCPTP